MNMEYFGMMDVGDWGQDCPWRAKYIILIKVDAKKYHGHDYSPIWTQKCHFQQYSDKKMAHLPHRIYLCCVQALKVNMCTQPPLS